LLTSSAQTEPCTKTYNRTAVLARALETPELSNIWQSNHCRTPSPAPKIAAQIHNIENNIGDHPELAAFTLAFLDIERKSLGKPTKKDTSQTQEIRDMLGTFELDLKQRTENIKLPKKSALPKEWQKMLGAIERHTGHYKISPFTSIWNITKKQLKEIGEDVKTRPITTSLLFATTGSMVWWINRRIGPSGNTYIDPKMLSIESLDLSDMEALMNDPDIANIVFNPDLMPTELEGSCHSHLTQLVGENAADFIENTLGATGLFPEHCSKLATLTYDTHARLNGIYDFANSRLDFLIRQPAEILGNHIGPTSPFKTAFDTAVNNTAESIYAFNTVENIALHSLIFASSMITTVKIGTMDSEERSEIKDKIVEFANRSLTSRPLNYLLLCSGSIGAYMASNGSAPHTIWGSVAGIALGEVFHKNINRHKNALPHVTGVFSNNTSIHQEEPKDSSPGTITISKAELEEEQEKQAKPWYSKWRNIFENPLAKAAPVATTATTLDIAATGGHYLGLCLGSLAVITPFLGVNLIEDTMIHLVFSLAGSTAGMAYLSAYKSTNASWNYITSKTGIKSRENTEHQEKESEEHTL